MADDRGNSVSQTDDNSQCADRGGANVRVIVSDSAAKWIVIVFLAFACAYAVIGERSDYDMARNASTDARVLQNHVMGLQAKLDAIFGPPSKERDHANTKR